MEIVSNFFVLLSSNVQKELRVFIFNRLVVLNSFVIRRKYFVQMIQSRLELENFKQSINQLIYCCDELLRTHTR